MPETLTQEQIDALFFGSAIDDSAEKESETVTTDEVTAESRRVVVDKKYKQYDFRNPKIFPKEHMRIMNLVHENYAKLLSTFLSGTLRTECVLGIIDIEEQRYYEYNNALPPAVMLGVFELSPVEGNLLIEIKRETCYTIIDRLLGGSGDNLVVPDDFSEIELKILGNFCEQALFFLRDAWTSFLDVTPKFKRIETNSRLSQLLPVEESIIIVAMSIKIMEHVSNMSICIPCVNLENVLGDTSIYMVNNRKPSHAEHEATKETILNNLKNTKVDVRGILGVANLTLKDLLQMQVGDIITLDKPIESPVTLKVGARDWFNGEIGSKKNKMAVRIKQVLQRP